LLENGDGLGIIDGTDGPFGTAVMEDVPYELDVGRAVT
jgi:hypothetical protein